MRTLKTVLAAATMAALFAVPAQAESRTSEFSVQEYGHITKEDTVTLSGTYRCVNTSPSGRIYLSPSLAQDGFAKGVGGRAARCDGAEHEWSVTINTADTPFHAGAAEVRPQLTSLGSGFPPVRLLASPAPVPVQLVDHR
ncbi:DUF6299 family protein [Streptomyces sp. NPDC006879]|uniref:DUF6299 family protein n=1 Tax=Streptomyces sp. NPDC006879 TaxID=3364767 RepID=UPI00367F04EA